MTTPDPAATAAHQPFVSVVIPVYNEEAHIAECLGSVLEQDYPAERYEVIVADGGSSDRTRAIVSEVGAGRNVHLIDNPGRIQATGLNLAIRAARGEIIARQDGHAVWKPHHLSHCVALLLKSGADNVGGRQEAIGECPMGMAIACALRSPFAVGGARFRYSRRMAELPTVYLGTFRRRVFEEIGLFNPAHAVHEDYELNHRIRQQGGRILYAPDINVQYYVRSSLWALAKQYFRYGRAKMRVARHHPKVIQPYHLIAPAAVLAGPMMVVAMLHANLRGLALACLGAYALGTAAASLHSGAEQSLRVRLRIPAVFPVMHAAWGIGFWAGVAEALLGRRSANLGPAPKLASGPAR